MIYRNRTDAGRRLAESLRKYAGEKNTIVLGLPRGGVPVAFEVARVLGAELDIFVSRKLGVPGMEEYAMGAISSGGIIIRNEEAVRMLNISEDVIQRVAAREKNELERRQRVYRGEKPPLNVAGRTVVLVDDGIATGATLKAAVHALRQMNPAKIVVAAPVGASDSCHELARISDEFICPAMPPNFRGVGQWYLHFDQTTDEEVQEILLRSRVPDLNNRLPDAV